MPRKHNTPERAPAACQIDKAKAYEVIWPQVAPLFEAARPYTNASFVYFIGEPDNGSLKVGFSKDPIGRLRNMQTGNPRRLRIEYVLVGAMAAEKLLHAFWEPHAIRAASHTGRPGAVPGTEWFSHEARTEMLPIVASAVDAQIALLGQEEAPSFGALEKAIREAHADSGFVAKT